MSRLPPLPPEFVRTVVDLHGTAGQDWLDSLASIVDACANRWSLTIQAPFSLTYNYVTPAVDADGRPCVLKLAPPSSRDFQREAAVLSAVDGQGAVAVLDYEQSLGAMLLERALPGDELWPSPSWDEDGASRVVADVLRRWRRPAPTSVPLTHLGEFADTFVRYASEHGSTGALPRGLVDDAARTFNALLESTDEQVLLHGDMHQGNILRSHRDGWLAIDPHGAVGDPAYDCAPGLRNPRPVLAAAPDLAGLLRNRVVVLAAALELDEGRIAAWGFAHAVLSEIWQVEVHGELQGVGLAVARALHHAAL